MGKRLKSMRIIIVTLGLMLIFNMVFSCSVFAVEDKKTDPGPWARIPFGHYKQPNGQSRHFYDNYDYYEEQK